MIGMMTMIIMIMISRRLSQSVHRPAGRAVDHLPPPPSPAPPAVAATTVADFCHRRRRRRRPRLLLVKCARARSHCTAQ